MPVESVIETKQTAAAGVAALAQIVAGPKRLYALLDACDEPLVWPKVYSLDSEKVASLFSGPAGRDFYEIAPYVAVADQALVDWIVDNLLDRPWGYFVVVDESITLLRLRKHFRRFMMATGPQGKDLYFRFYDPRVVTVFAKSFSAETVGRFFGPLHSVLLFDEDKQLLTLQVAEFSSANAASDGPDRRKLNVTEADLRNYVQYRDQEFQRRLVSHLSELLEQENRPVDRKQLNGQVERGLFAAKRYLLKKQSDIARYLEIICLHLGRVAHDGEPMAAQNIMFDRRLEISQRLDGLEKWAIEQSMFTAKTGQL
jgi:hypothetical protein